MNPALVPGRRRAIVAAQAQAEKVAADKSAEPAQKPKRGKRK